MVRPGIYTKNAEKNTPQAETLNPKKIPPKTRKPKMDIFGIFGVCFRYFQGIFGVNSGSPEFRAGVSVFFVEIPGRAISGLCSRSGRSQEKIPK